MVNDPTSLCERPRSLEIPYFSQFESRDLVEAFVTGQQSSREDPLWEHSGASSESEYAFWAGEICGMACLKMFLAARCGKIIPTITLAKSCAAYGGYKISDDSKIKGLIYAGLVTFLKDSHNIESEVVTDLATRDIAEIVKGPAMFIASVHPQIRTPAAPPPSKGGHLVLVFDYIEQRDELLFHNPSGFEVATQERVPMKVELFDQFFAGRGVILR